VRSQKFNLKEHDIYFTLHNLISDNCAITLIALGLRDWTNQLLEFVNKNVSILTWNLLHMKFHRISIETYGLVMNGLTVSWVKIY